MSDAVVFESVTFSYPGGTRALTNVSLSLPEGSFVLVCGATGSGKSTLIRMINGLVPHFSGGTFEGRVLVAGRDTIECAPRDLADVAAFVPQDPDAAFVLDNVEDELAYSLENLGIEPSVMRRRVEETMDLLNIASLRERSIRSLSGGERQRVAIAAALSAGPRLLLLDEPTSQLDPQGAEDVLAALQRLVHDIGMTVVLAEHRLERVVGFVDCAVACGEGGHAVLSTPAEALQRLDSGPPVTRLGRRMDWSPPPLTVREARRAAEGMRLQPSPRSRAAPGEAVLEAAGVRASYGGRAVLEDLHLTLWAGEITALMGRNGAGKTTLLRCLAGLHKGASGRVSVHGAPVDPGHTVALCPQASDAVLFKDTVEDEIAATPGAGRDGDTADLLEDLGLVEVARRHPRDLSAGQRLLVATAAVAATGAPVLLLDEPTRGLEYESKIVLIEFLKKWSAPTSPATAGRTVMLATHDVELVAELGARVVMLAEGEVIADGEAELLGDSPVFAPQMARVFGAGWLTVDQVVAAL